jgi:hypothetical protein
LLASNPPVQHRVTCSSRTQKDDTRLKDVREFWRNFRFMSRATLNERFFNLPVACVVICGLVGGQNGLKKLVDDGNLTYFIIRYRLLLLFYYCYRYKNVVTHKSLRASLFPGAAELTTHLLRLINILWLPLCRINKFGFYFSRRLLRSPILVGHHSTTNNHSRSA